MTESNGVESEILKKLDEYGQTFMVGDGRKKKEKKGSSVISGKHSNVSSEATNLSKQNTPTHSTGTNLSRRQKKRLKKKLAKNAAANASVTDNTKNSRLHVNVPHNNIRKHKDDEDDEFSDNFTESEDNDSEDDLDKTETQSEPRAKSSQLELLSKELGLAEFKQEQLKTQTSTEKTKTREAEVIVFKAHKRKIRDTDKADKKDGKRAKVEKIPFHSDGPEFDMRQARFEVQKFGIAGFQGNKKEEAMTSLLIKLGAKPPKNKYINYKEYQENKKQATEEAKQKEEMQEKKPAQKKKSKDNNRKKRRDKNDVGSLDGQVGRWKHGVQIVKKADLKGFQKSKIKM